MSTTSTTIRINSEIKEQVTPILNTLGISVGEAVNMFLHQIKLHNGIPFDLTIRTHPLSADLWTDKQNAEFWADVAETHAAVANGTAEFYKTTDEFRKAMYEIVNDGGEV